MDNYEIKNDILLVAYYMKKNGWDAISKTNFQRILYFAAVLSPTFLGDYAWSYSFYNTMYGPTNKDLTSEIEDLYIKGLLLLSHREIKKNRVEEKYEISDNGIKIVEDSIMKIEHEVSKILWIETIVKVITIYEDTFLPKFIKGDPNISLMNLANQKTKISIENTEKNLSNELLKYLEENGKEKLHLEEKADEEYLLLFFDLLYRKYKGGK